MIKRYNNISLLLGFPGLIVQLVGIVKDRDIFSSFLFWLGTLFLWVGFAFYAKAKGRSPLWGIFACLGLPGLLLLAVLKDKNK